MVRGQLRTEGRPWTRLELEPQSQLIDIKNDMYLKLSGFGGFGFIIQ